MHIASSIATPDIYSSCRACGVSSLADTAFTLALSPFSKQRIPPLSLYGAHSQEDNFFPACMFNDMLEKLWPTCIDSISCGLV